ncbi:cysteine--tRNA ligase [Azorhizobium sp. AG788]|uniref:cysteine--tRNA ligase n=1 Tax=Azorhizobium sp. AG788 TaxID=2183897 RepID=UPI0031387B6E
MLMELRLYNTLTRSKDAFRPLDPANVRLYVCGPTVYDLAHIGNARPVIVFDVLFRLLRRLYGADAVTYVRNITDVDDKINARAADRGITIRDLTEETYDWFRQDTAALGCLPPSVEPRATEHIREMQALIERLVASGHAYVAEDHVLFDVPSMPDYGQLSRRPLDEMLNGARVDVAPFKRDPMDFVLWKPSSDDQPGWPSPCGIETPGRPGWHIECSAMSWRHLGETFDIHGGGIDLVFPHHENEIAQSRCAFGTGGMAQVWMHNGFLLLEGEKMSKSLGNFVTIRELLADWEGEVLRLAMLSTHYRQPINWTRQGIGFAAKTLDKWYRVVGDVEADTGPDNPFESEIADRLGDDLNSPRAITHLHHLAEVAEHEDTSSALRRRFKGAANLLGLLQLTETQWKARQREAIAVDPEAIEALIAARIAARKARDFAAADHIREQLAAQGVILMDNKDGTTSWELGR